MTPADAPTARRAWSRIGTRVAMVAALLVAGNALYAEQRAVAAIAAGIAALIAVAGMVRDRH